LLIIGFGCVLRMGLFMPGGSDVNTIGFWGASCGALGATFGDSWGMPLETRRHSSTFWNMDATWVGGKWGPQTSYKETALQLKSSERSSERTSVNSGENKGLPAHNPSSSHGGGPPSCHPVCAEEIMSDHMRVQVRAQIRAQMRIQARAELRVRPESPHAEL
jgi:hypothetical protein